MNKFNFILYIFRSPRVFLKIAIAKIGIACDRKDTSYIYFSSVYQYCSDRGLD
jgi:hypothetical protein